MRRRRLHPGQLEIDFSVPAKDPLTVSEVAAALNRSNSEIYKSIQEGRIAAVTTHRVDADRERFIIPLTNFIHYLNERYTDALYFRFPEHDQLTLRQIANALSCSHEHARHLLNDGEFPRAHNMGRHGIAYWKIPIVDLVDYVNRNRFGAYC